MNALNKKHMATISQKQLFVWSDYENSADFYKLNLILKNIPDEKLMQKLENKRSSSGVNKYPIRPVWNSLLIHLKLKQHIS